MRKGSKKPILEDLNSIHIKDIDHSQTVGGMQRLNDGYWIETTSQRCNYGGLRWFFVCPNCSRSVMRLYYQGDKLICRKCTGGRYWTENRAKALRIKKKLDAVLERLQSPNIESMKKPKGMQTTTFTRLEAQAQNLDGQLKDWLQTKIEYEQAHEERSRRFPKHKNRVRLSRASFRKMFFGTE